MWRYLPPSLLMVCAALILIAGATGDLQFWSQSIDDLPSWRSMVDARPWSPLTDVWNAGVARLRHHPAPDTPAAVPSAAAAAAPPQPPAATTPDPQSSLAQSPIAQAAAALQAPAPETAASPLQQRLRHARDALAAGRAAEARKMLESARSEMASPSPRESNAARFDMPRTWLEHALLSLKSGDSPGALHDLDLAIASS